MRASLGFELDVFNGNMATRAARSGEKKNPLALLILNIPGANGIRFGIHKVNNPGQALKALYKGLASPSFISPPGATSVETLLFLKEQLRSQSPTL